VKNAARLHEVGMSELGVAVVDALGLVASVVEYHGDGCCALSGHLFQTMSSGNSGAK
jgi:hypothetical protein